jgi:hypothetical protein
VGAYATPEAYAAANGQGSDIPVGVTFAGRVNVPWAACSRCFRLRYSASALSAPARSSLRQPVPS